MARKPKTPEPLAEYARKRDFTATPEPRERSAGLTALRFVVQKHRATRLHYDFRLEAGGVLASWAVPKGPSLDTQERRLAMHVEDHPYDYRTFEGVIPGRQLRRGRGDRVGRGHLHAGRGHRSGRRDRRGQDQIHPHGKKLHGMFSLVRIKTARDQSGEPWLLIKESDEFVDPKFDVERAPREREDGQDARGHRREPDREEVAERSRGRIRQARRRAKRGQGRTAAARHHADAGNARRRARSTIQAGCSR